MVYENNECMRMRLLHLPGAGARRWKEIEAASVTHQYLFHLKAVSMHCSVSWYN